MKLSKLFHTLYATVMALPVIIIPIFAININQKSVEPISIEVQEDKIVDFNQLIPDSTKDVKINQVNNASVTRVYTIDLLVENHVYILKWYQDFNLQSNTRNTFYLDKNSTYVYENEQSNNNLNEQYYFWRFNNTFEGTTLLAYWFTPNIAQDLYLRNIQLFDLTQMFGIGNEPQINEFNEHYNDDYYSYTLSHKELIYDVTTTYDDTDIGSQFVYALYKPVNDYFNFGKFFGLSGMYDWFQLNIFNGTAPLSFFIVFNVMIYWLFISLFWLLFDILIYVPMVIHKWLDKAEM